MTVLSYLIWRYHHFINYTPPPNILCWRYIGFTLSFHPSVSLSVHPTSDVHSVAPTVLSGSSSYLYILSSNFRRCVLCKVSCKVGNFNFVLFWLGSLASGNQLCGLTAHKYCPKLIILFDSFFSALVEFLLFLLHMTIIPTFLFPGELGTKSMIYHWTPLGWWNTIK